ncbi:putative membrane protein [Sphingomonas sp. PvP107]
MTDWLSLSPIAVTPCGMATSSPLDDLSQRLLGKRPGELDDAQRRVLAGIEAGTTVSRDAANLADERATVGERLSDRVAAVGGSWGFIIAFTAVLLGWMLLNSGILTYFGRAFDPYPYIFLNLLLSTVAAIQAPIIMMSQNRQSAKDRLAASLDYETNLRAELDILRVHHKIDHLVLARLDAIEAKIDALAKTGPGA